MSLRVTSPLLPLLLLGALSGPPARAQEWVAEDAEEPIRIEAKTGEPQIFFLRGPGEGLERIEALTVRGGYLGVAVTDLTAELRGHFGLPEDRGVLVARVEEDSPAASAGIAVGDFLLAVDGEAVATGGDLRRAILRREPAEPVDVEVQRETARLDFTVELAERPRLQVDLGRALLAPPAPGGPPPLLEGFEGARDLAEPLREMRIHGIDFDPERFEAAIREGLGPDARERLRAYRERNEELESRLEGLEVRLRELEQALQKMDRDD